MNTYVHQVGDLNHIEALEMSSLNYDFSLMSGHKLEVDFKAMTHFEPFAMLISSHTLKKWNNLADQYNVKLEYTNYQHCSYAAHMGFFKSFGLDYGNEPNEATGSSKYLPLSIINVHELRDTSSTRREKIQDTIERKSTHLASILGQGNYELEVTLSYAIREIMRNVVEHSLSNKIYFAAQRWGNIGNVEIAIFDEGIGIKETLSSNPNLNIDNDLTALNYSLLPGISGKAYYKDGILQNSSTSEWGHSGFGLYVTSELCKIGGEFTIVSNGASFTSNAHSQWIHDAHINGTGIRLKLKLDEIPDLGDSVINDIVQKGEQLAAISQVHAISSASKMSRVLTK
ncbi:ATP-binding protein [Priestia megaterium]